jgi:flagellin
MTENLQRIRELAVQSSNATNSDDDRVALQAEVKQLLAEVSRTAEETNFNGRNLLDGSFTGTFQIGADAGQTVDVKISELTAEKLGVGDATGVSAQGTGSALQNGDLIINGVAIDPSRANSDSASFTDAGASAIAKVAAINAKSDETGVKAEVSTNVAAGSEMVAAAETGTVSLNGVDIEVSTGGVNLQADRESVISAINAKTDQTGVMAVDGGDTGGVILEAEDGRNITLTFGGDFGDGDGTLTADEQSAAQAATGLTAGTSYGGYTLISDDGSDIDIQGGAGTGTGDIRNAGLTAGVYSGKQAAVTTTERSAGIILNETESTFTTGAFTIGADTQINATNNSFEVSLNGSTFAEFVLAADKDVGSGAGEYDDVTQLAAQINASLADTSIAENAVFRDASDNPLFTAVGNAADGTISFQTAETGEDANIVARTGNGTIAIPEVAVETQGTGDETVQTFTFSQMKFDGNNEFSTNNVALDLDFTNGAGTSVFDITLDQTTAANGSAFTAQEVVDLVNAELINDSIEATASVADDGVTLVITANAGSADPYTAIADGGTLLQATELQDNFQLLSNGTSVITDVDQFAQLLGANAADEVGFVVDGAAQADVDFGNAAALQTAYEAFAGAGTFATDLAAAQSGTNDNAQAQALSTFMNNVFATQAAGSGITASAVGDQVVLSSDTGATGTVGIKEAAANSIGTAAVLTGGAAGTDTVNGTSGMAITGAFNVDEEGYFMSADPDPLDADVEAQRTALQIQAGFNDTFDVDIDGSGVQTVTIGPGSYETMDQLATAINSALPSSGTSAVASADGSVDLNDTAVLATLDFTGTGELEFDVTVDGTTLSPVRLAVDYTAAGSGSDADIQAALLGDINAQLNVAFGSAVSASIDSGTGALTFTTTNTGSGASVAISNVDTDPDTDGAAASDLGLVATGTVTGSSGATVSVSDDNTQLEFTSSSTSAISAVDITNGKFAIEGTFTAGANVTQLEVPNALESGDLVLNGTAIGAANALSDTASDTTAETSDGAASGIATAAAINASTEQTGVTATVNATSLNGGTSTTAATGTEIGSIGTVTINNVETGTIQLTGEADRDRATAIDAINAVSGQTGVVAEDNGESITLTAADGRNISVAIDNKLAQNQLAGFGTTDFGSKIGLSSAGAGIGEADFDGTSANYANTAGTTYSTVTLTAAGEINVENGVNGTDEVEALGLQLGAYGGGENGTFLKDLDITTFEGAQDAISAIDNALQTVASQRAELGALQNRFESTSSNLQITSENLSAANSRIRDADFAAETAELSRTQVLQQAGISILAQANQRPQQVLSLLG